MGAYRFTPTHYAIGTSYHSPCGILGMDHRAIKFTRKPERTTCGHCKRWLRKQQREVKP